MREEIKAVEKLKKKAAERLEKDAQGKGKRNETNRTLNIRKPSYRITSIRRQMLFPEKIAMRLRYGRTVSTSTSSSIR